MAYEIYLKTSNGITKISINAETLGGFTKDDLLNSIPVKSVNGQTGEVVIDLEPIQNDIAQLKQSLLGVEELVGSGVV